MSYGALFTAVGAGILIVLALIGWLADRHERRAWWREERHAEWRRRWR